MKLKTVKCQNPDCGGPDLVATVTLSTQMALAKRGNAVLMKGVKVHQIMLKDAWLDQGEFRGPLVCAECGSEHFQIVNDDGIHYFLGNVDDAREVGAEAFLEE